MDQAAPACVAADCIAAKAPLDDPSLRICPQCHRPLGGAAFGPDDAYVVEALIGIGYFAEVFRVRYGRGQFAVKVYADGAATRQAAANEIQAYSHLRHRRMPRLRDQFDDGDRIFLVMDLVSGRNLRDEVGASGPLSLPQALRLGLEVGQLLGHVASRGWTYRDLHPKNIHRATPIGCRVVDFDGARPPGAPGEPGGRIGYRAPELAAGGPATAACDVYSLAGCIHFALTGEDPTGASAPLLADSPLGHLLHACRRPEPDERPTLRHLRRALRATSAMA